MPWIDLEADFGGDWSNAAFLNQYRNALYERAYVVDQATSFVNSYQGGVVAAGRDVQSYLLIRNWQLFLAGVLMLRFVNPANINYSTYTPLVYPPNFGWTQAQWRAAAGLNSLGFTRKYPREISATTDAGSVGQIARHRQSAQIYQHDGSGWQLAEDQLLDPDVLTTYGYMLAGDYIGPWLFNELRGGINVLTHVQESKGWSETVAYSRGFSGNWSSSHYSSVEEGVADVQAKAQANWPNVTSVIDDSGNATFPPNFSAVPHAVSWWGATTYYNAGLHRRIMRPTRPGKVGYRPYTATIHIVPQAARFPIWGSSSGAVHPTTHGESFNFDNWNLIFNGPVTFSTLMPAIGSIGGSVMPEWWPTDPNGGNHQYGWQATRTSSVLEYQFDYRTS